MHFPAWISALHKQKRGFIEISNIFLGAFVHFPLILLARTVLQIGGTLMNFWPKDLVMKILHRHGLAVFAFVLCPRHNPGVGKPLAYAVINCICAFSFAKVTVYIERLQFFGFRIFEQVGNFLYTGYVISNEKMLEDFIADQNIAQ
uniref:Uncharacterized protein n=1 Tax=Opuntia streptacantha TaxID=393608 RepID=A0A7C8YYC6_OPUST